MKESYKLPAMGLTSFGSISGSGLTMSAQNASILGRIVLSSFRRVSHPPNCTPGGSGVRDCFEEVSLLYKSGGRVDRASFKASIAGS